MDRDHIIAEIRDINEGLRSGYLTGEDAIDQINFLEFFVEDYPFLREEIDLLRVLAEKHDVLPGLVEATKGARRGVQLRHRGGYTVIHLAVRGDGDGKWQVTKFDADMRPYSHRNAHTIEEALRDVVREERNVELVRFNFHDATESWAE